MSQKGILILICSCLAVLYIILGLCSKDNIQSEHYFTRSVIFNAATFIITST